MTKLDRAKIDDDTPLPLKDAAQLAFPAGGMGASGLRLEAQRGNLVVERIAGRPFTTLRAIKDMRAKCRAAQTRPASTSDSEKDAQPNGSSEIDHSRLALARAGTIAEKLKRRSQNTLTKNIPQPSAKVIPIKS